MRWQELRETAATPRGWSVGDQPIHRAAAMGHIETLQALSRTGPTPFPPRSTRRSDGQELVELGAKPSARNSNGVTPAHYAARAGHLEIVELLKKLGAQSGGFPFESDS